MVRQLRLALMITITACSARGMAADAEYQTYEKPVPGSVLEEQGSLEPALGTETSEYWLLPRVNELKEFYWDKATLTLKPRSYYLNKQRDGTSDRVAWAAGGSLEYKTALYKDTFSTGATIYTSQKLYGPRDKDGTRLLRDGQKEITVLGEAYLDIRLNESINARLYRQGLNLPYLNKYDIRMIPNTFEAYNITGKRYGDRFSYGIGHVTKMKELDSSSFKYMSDIAGANDTKKGLSVVGARYSLNKTLNGGMVNQYAWDVMNTFYIEGNSAWDLKNDVALRISGQYTKQQSVGDELIGDFDTSVYGLKLGASYKNAILSLAYTSTDDDHNILSPFGGYPGYASIIIKDFDRAGEDAWLVGLSYNAAALGLDGLSVFANYVDGDTPDSGSNASPDQQELDITADYYFPKTFADGLWLRTRVALLNQQGPDATDQQDYRIILNYTLPLH
jgi:hypothetical protein